MTLPNIKKQIAFFFAILSIGAFAQPLSKTYIQYVNTYNQLAIIQQNEHGIPASITLAQGLLESGAGQSEFARKSNNHFGIKCHEWTGDKVYHDDDEKGECFRKYEKVLDSYEDHSLFLKNRQRYASLFTLSPTDYESWAHGLKKAGYATDPVYAFKLISLIENYELHKYDLTKLSDINIESNKTAQIIENRPSIGKIGAIQQHKLYKNNRVRCVIAEYGDTYGSIADEFNISESRLVKYNDLNTSNQLNVGAVVYLKHKKNKASKEFSIHNVQEGETMYNIAQKYAIKLEELYTLNKIPFNQTAKVGQELKLR